MPAWAIEVSCCGAATTASTSPAMRGFDGGGAERDRGAAGDGADDAEWQRCGVGLRAGQDANDRRIKSARPRVAGEQIPIADDDRIAHRANGGIERSLQRDLRSDAGRIANRNSDLDFVG